MDIQRNFSRPWRDCIFGKVSRVIWWQSVWIAMCAGLLSCDRYHSANDGTPPFEVGAYIYVDDSRKIFIIEAKSPLAIVVSRADLATGAWASRAEPQAACAVSDSVLKSWAKIDGLARVSEKFLGEPALSPGRRLGSNTLAVVSRAKDGLTEVKYISDSESMLRALEEVRAILKQCGIGEEIGVFFGVIRPVPSPLSPGESGPKKDE